MFSAIFKEQRKAKKLSQKDVAEYLKVNQATISDWENNKGSPSINHITKINELFGVNILDPDGQAPKLDLSSDTVMIKFYEDIRASAGEGTECFSDDFELVSISKKLLSPKIDAAKHYAIKVFGDSMFPTFNDGDVIFVEPYNNEFVNNKVYIFKRENEIYIKRLRKSLDHIEVISDNRDYEKYFVGFEEISIIAKVI